MNAPDSDTGEVTTALDQIIDLNERIRSFWQKRAGGWASRKATTMLKNSGQGWAGDAVHKCQQVTKGNALLGQLVVSCRLFF